MGEATGVLLIGATGLVGSAVRRELQDAGWAVRNLPAPRLAVELPQSSSLAGVVDRLLSEVQGPRYASVISEIVQASRTATVIVNAAGLARPDISSVTPDLIGANGLLPGLLAAAAMDHQRVVHVSSAAASGCMRPINREVAVEELTPYGLSKAAGEAVLLGTRPTSAVYRPLSVMARNRGLACRIGGAIRWRLLPSDVRGEMRLPLQTLSSLGRAVAVITENDDLDGVLIHADEGWTTGRLYGLNGSAVPWWSATLRSLSRAASAVARPGLRVRLSLLASGGWVQEADVPKRLRRIASTDREMREALGLDVPSRSRARQ